MFKFIAKQPFWVNLIIALVLVCILAALFLQSLNWMTNHGAYLKVPAVKGKKVDEGIKLLESQGFEVVIQDSIYQEKIPRYTITKQLPEPDATVKANRTVFLTINRATPPNVDMPKLEGLSYRYAVDKLQKNHLILKDTIQRPDFMKGSVLEQQFNNDRINAGTKIPWGSKITLVIGAGLQVQQVLVPDLIGLTYEEARQLLKDKGISLAGVIPMSTVRDTANAFVYKQNPETRDVDHNRMYIQPGQTIDIWLSEDQPEENNTNNSPIEDSAQ